MNSLVLLSLYLFACKKGVNSPDPCSVTPCLDTVPYKYELMWHRSFHPTEGKNFSTVPYLVGDVLITSYLADEADYSYIHGYNAVTGEHLWTWVDYQYGKYFLHLRETKEVYDNKLIISTVNDYHAIDPISGQTLWAVEKPSHLSNSPSMVRINDYLYEGGRALGSSNYTAEVYRMPLSNPGAFETLFVLEDTTEVKMRISLASLHLSVEGDSILMFIGKGYNIDDPKKDKTAYYAYNLTHRVLIWSREYLNEDGRLMPPLIDAERMYVAPSFNRIECLDLKTGATVWEKPLTKDGFMQTGDIILEEGVLIAVNNNGWIFAIHPETGQEIWSANTSSFLSGGSPNKIEAHKGIVYIANASVGCNLSAWDVHTGENYWCEYSINANTCSDCSISASGLTIDKERGLLYTTDGYEILCMKTIR